jgi:hypothetical protein
MIIQVFGTGFARRLRLALFDYLDTLALTTLRAKKEASRLRLDVLMLDDKVIATT